MVLTLADGDYALMYRADASSAWREVMRHTADEVFEPVMLSADGTSLVALTNRGRAQTDLVRMALPGGEISEISFPFQVLTLRACSRVMSIATCWE